MYLSSDQPLARPDVDRCSSYDDPVGANRNGTATASRLLARLAAFCATAGVILVGVWSLGDGGDSSIVAKARSAYSMNLSMSDPPEADGAAANPAVSTPSSSTTNSTTTTSPTPTTTSPTTSTSTTTTATTVPRSTTTPPATTTPEANTTATTEPSLADLLDPIDRDAAIPDVREPRPSPTGLQISSINVSGNPIREIGLNDDGQLEIPDETEIGWYRYGATAGDSGATVLAAHVSWKGSIGPFFELDSLEPGAQIEVTLDDGTRRLYEVTERTLYEKENLPRERIWRNTGPEELVLITCGGDFNPEIRRYRHNVVVYARPF